MNFPGASRFLDKGERVTGYGVGFDRNEWIAEDAQTISARPELPASRQCDSSCAGRFTAKRATNSKTEKLLSYWRDRREFYGSRI